MPSSVFLSADRGSAPPDLPEKFKGTRRVRSRGGADDQDGLSGIEQRDKVVLVGEYWRSDRGQEHQTTPLEFNQEVSGNWRELFFELLFLTIYELWSLVSYSLVSFHVFMFGLRP